jgi:hypothetical protein
MRHVALLLISILAFAWWTRAYAQVDDAPQPEPVILTDEQDQYPLGLHMEILEDPSSELTIEDVVSPEFDSRFAPSQVEVPNYGFTNSAYWVRLNLRNGARLNDHWLLEVGFANMQFVDLYTPLPDGDGFEVKQTGALRPPETRDIRHPRIILDLRIPAQSQQTYYLRFQNGASMTLPLTLWTPNAFLMETQLDLGLYGIYFGALIVLLLYNLFLFFSLREIN